jgi:hypothetical protein
MADYYVDHGAYASALGTTPTWGTPQEGDGSATAAASAVSIGSIVLNALPSAGNLLSICGITFGATSGGTVNYTIGGSITATVDNIVAAINGCTTAVGSSVAIGVPQLRNLVFARNTSGTTVEIMMRVGSDKLNHATNSNVGITQSGWGTPCTLTQFIGGTGGCWGWLFNPTAIGVSSSIAQHAYGVVAGAVMVWTGTPSLADPIWARTGSGKTITTTSLGTSVNRTGAWDMRLIFDTNTKWTGDSGTGVVLFAFTYTANNSSASLFNTISAVQHTQIFALMQGGLKVQFNCTQVTFGFGIGGTNSGNGGEGCIQATYCDFTNIGDSSHNALKILLDNRQLTSSLANCTFTNCAK